ncbi:MAG TPA: hypothetical protein PLF21_07880 [Exilispira sp.]|nr:hypothetical protein [Exilispira sp.]
MNNKNTNVKVIIFIVDIGNENIKIFREGKIKVFIDNNFVAIAQDKTESVLL